MYIEEKVERMLKRKFQPAANVFICIPLRILALSPLDVAMMVSKKALA